MNRQRTSAEEGMRMTIPYKTCSKSIRERAKYEIGQKADNNNHMQQHCHATFAKSF